MANMRLILIVGIVLAILAYISVIINDRGLRMDAFTDLEQKTNVFTMYYMNGCPHCESILPDYKNFAASGQIILGEKKTNIRMLEQADPAAAPELESRNVKGFPTFILGTKDGMFVEYQGERSIDAIKSFIGQNAV